MRSKPALIIVDLLEDFAEGGTLPVKGARRIAKKVNKLLPQYETIIATNDCHPQGHCSFQIWPDHCVNGTPGAEFIKELSLGDVQIKVFPKGTHKDVDSYSGFLDNDGITGTGLREYLVEKDIKEVHIVGVATDYCIKATALDARKFGFETIVLEKYVAPVNVNPGDGRKAKQEMRNSGVIFK